jgi:tetratricopeptide (TPR) repeat protein
MDNQPSPKELTDQAQLAYQSGDYAQAAQSYAQAAQLYSGMGDPLMAAEMLNNRSVALLRAKEPQASLEAAQGTEKIFANAGDFRRQGMALANQASALQALKQYNESIQHFKDSGDALEKAGEDVLRVEVMQLLTMLYLRRFKFYEAILALQSGLSGVKNPTPRQRFMKKILFFHL